MIPPSPSKFPFPHSLANQVPDQVPNAVADGDGMMHVWLWVHQWLLLRRRRRLTLAMHKGLVMLPVFTSGCHLGHWIEKNLGFHFKERMKPIRAELHELHCGERNLPFGQELLVLDIENHPTPKPQDAKPWVLHTRHSPHPENHQNMFWMSSK